jgi:hypothetical protein
VNVAVTVATLVSFYVFLQIVEEVALHRDTMMLNGSQAEGGGDGGAGERSVINHVIESFVEASMDVLAAAAEEFTHSDEGGRTVDERGERERERGRGRTGGRRKTILAHSVQQNIHTASKNGMIRILITNT